METTKQGDVYILTNPSFKEDWVKIGKSSRPVDVRSKELDNTAVPLPFEIYATLKTCKYSEVERAVHQTIDSLLINASTNRSDLGILLDSHEEYMLNRKTAEQIISEVTSAVGGWKAIATELGITKRETSLFEARFAKYGIPR